jgi:hypothetical protein
MKPPATSRPGANEAALRRLGVSAKELGAAPEITSLLKRADGGLRQCLAAMRFSDEPLIRAFFSKYDSLSGHDRKHLPLEAVALSAGINIVHLLGAILVALQAQSINIVKIIAVSHHPKITEARVQYGQLPFGEKDRNALDVAMGFLPSPKGPTFIGKAIFGSGQTVMMQPRGDEDDEVLSGDELDLDRLFPPPRNMQERLNGIRQRILPQPDGKQVN